jgi:hypothetical protein
MSLIFIDASVERLFMAAWMVERLTNKPAWAKVLIAFYRTNFE